MGHESSMLFAIPKNRVTEENLTLLSRKLLKKRRALREKLSYLLCRRETSLYLEQIAELNGIGQLASVRAKESLNAGRAVNLNDYPFWYLDYDSLQNDMDEGEIMEVNSFKLITFQDVEIIRPFEENINNFAMLDMNFGKKNNLYSLAQSENHIVQFVQDLEIIIELFSPVFACDDEEGMERMPPVTSNGLDGYSHATYFRFYPKKFVEKVGKETLLKLVPESLDFRTRGNIFIQWDNEYKQNCGFYTEIDGNFLIAISTDFKNTIIDGKPYWQYQYELNKELFDMIKNGEL